MRVSERERSTEDHNRTLTMSSDSGFYCSKDPSVARGHHQQNWRLIQSISCDA